MLIYVNVNILNIIVNFFVKIMFVEIIFYNSKYNDLP